jgi:hypothetical protein
MSIDLAGDTSGIAIIRRPSSLTLAAALLLSFGQSALAQTPLPANVKPTCTVSSAEFNG